MTHAVEELSPGIENLLRTLAPRVLGVLARREETAVLLEPPPDDPVPDEDDTLTLVFLCCHPALAPASAIALTLRAVGGLTTAEIAAAFLVPEATMAQRISRAKQRVKASGASFRLPPPRERAELLRSVRHVLYLLFNEGYAASSGSAIHRIDLSDEAIRLARLLITRPPPPVRRASRSGTTSRRRQRNSVPATGDGGR